MALYKEIAPRVVNLDSLDLSTKRIAELMEVSERSVRRARQWMKELNDQRIYPTVSEHKHVGGTSELTGESLVVDAPPLEYPSEPPEDVIIGIKRNAPEAKQYTVMASENSITISVGDESETITASDEKFPLVSDIVWENRGSQESLAEAFEQMSYKQQFIKMTKGLVEIDSAKGAVLYDGHQIAAGLTNRIIEACQDGDEKKLTGLVEFTHKLHENPSRRAVMELFGFLEAADILIREDGLVEAFKRVRHDYYDFFTGKTRNKPGDEPFMYRWEVDENQHETCSDGYHVCAKSYLPHYHGGDGRVVKCLVHPKDFVSIPVDHQNAKARVCRYKVISELHAM